MTGSTSGHSLIEVLVAQAILLLVLAGVMTLGIQTAGLARRHPDRLELHQRARVALDLITRDIRQAGAGVDHGPAIGPLSMAVASIWPRRLGRGGDSAAVVRDDTITLLAVADGVAQSSLATALSGASVEALVVAPAAHCRQSHPACGFAPDATIAAFDGAGTLLLATVDQVRDATLTIQALARPAQELPAGSAVAGLTVRGYRWDRAARQLRYFDGDSTDQPVIDGVTGLRFRYFSADGEISLGSLGDGPWRGGGATSYDADLSRIRRVRVELEITAGGSTFVTMTDVAPRNLAGPGGIPE